MVNLIAAAIEIPKGSGLNSLVNGFIGWVVSFIGNYGLAIIVFTLLLRLILLPLDFLNKYLTKNNAAKMAEFKDEDAELKKQYAADPMKYMTARREMYRRNGYKPGFSSLFMLVNAVLTVVIFITVYGCVNSISSTNFNRQYKELATTYIQYEQTATIDTEEFKTELNATYEEYNVSFIWVHNIFRPDTWASKTPSLAEFKTATKTLTLPLAADATTEEKDAYIKTMHETIIKDLNANHKSGWNGYFILVVLSAVTMYFSTVINTATQKKKKLEESKKEIEVGYSIRKTREVQSDNPMPQLDPAAMGNVMKFVLPIVMVIVTFSSTAAIALYIIAGAVIQSTLGLGINFFVDLMLKKQEARKKEKQPKHPVINPHSRYFKKEYK